jgi:hypothetical protein
MSRRRNAITAAVAVLAAAVLAGCGSAGPHEQVDRTMRAWHQALVDGDGQRWCNMLTQSARERIERDNAALASLSCVEVIDTAGPLLTQGQARKIRALRVRDVDIHDGRAIVRRTDVADLGPNGLLDETGTVLVREEGAWRIDDLG